MKDYYIYYDNGFVRQSNATVPVLSASTQFGLNVFEGIRVYKEDFYYIFRLEDHLKRLNNSLNKIGFDVEAISTNQFIVILKELIVLNEIDTDFSIRVTYLINEIDSWSSTKRPVFFIAPLIKERNSTDTYKTAVVTTTRRISSYAMNTKIKVGANYINGRYALLEAKSKGADLPILRTKDGFISESSGACIFLVKNGVVITPSLDCDILESITRDTVIKIFLEHKYIVEERLISEAEFSESDEIFLCGSAAEITPIKPVEKNNFRIGDLTRFIFHEYQLAITAKSYKDYSWTTQLDLKENS
jgi:branched-chain amino acid aminotransferase